MIVCNHKWRVVDHKAYDGLVDRAGVFQPIRITKILLSCAKCGVEKSKQIEGEFKVIERATEEPSTESNTSAN